jgi:NAD(P)H-hydrate epimerase
MSDGLPNEGANASALGSAELAELAVLTPEEMAEADRLTIESGVSGFTLMKAAGAAVAIAAQEMAPGGSVLILAGPGNNGGDGFVAAAELRRAGRHVRVALLGAREKLSGDAARAAAGYDGPVETLGPDTAIAADLVVDAFFGAGLVRPLEGEAAAIVGPVNASGRPVLAVDLPSGIDGRTGEVRGVAIRARRTVTFFRLKPGHLLMPGRDHCGPTDVVQIGIPDAVLARIAPQTFRNGPGLWSAALRRPAASGHKYSRGHALVVSGPATATGAARLAAAGALRVGAGAVTVASPPDALLVNAAHLTAIMLRGFDGAGALAELISDRRIASIVLGPANGVGEPTRRNVEAALASAASAVLDADALTSFMEAPERLFGLIAAKGEPVVLTPHEGEFARLFSDGGAKIDRARRAAELSGAVVVLKGPDTVIAAPAGRLAINDNAPPDLATAGSGDVLAGMIAGLLAQGLPAFEGAAAAVWLHGAAGQAMGAGLIAEDLPGALPGVLKRLYADAS